MSSVEEGEYAAASGSRPGFGRRRFDGARPRRSATLANVLETDDRRELRRTARGLGFERLGFAAAGRSRDADRYHAWLAAGHHADLAYLERDPERRVDPRRVLPGCRSVLVGTVSYHQVEDEEPDALAGEVARYARGRDYHRVLRRCLKDLCRALDDVAGCRGVPEARHRWYVDTGPVVERAWAAEAGVGFTGKNACLIDPRRGSWSLLGVVLTTLEFPPDEPVTVGCGSCTRCLDACPTGAIVAPGEVDSRLCISYWTIEHRGSIPVELRASIGRRVFGCDECQVVCPWNRFAQPTGVADLRPRDALADVDLSSWAGLSWDDWDELTRGTAVRRAGYEGLLRNVAVALGNSGDARARGPLERLAEHESELVREHARWGLERLDRVRLEATT